MFRVPGTESPVVHEFPKGWTDRIGGPVDLR